MLAMLPRLRDQGHNIVLVEQNATLTSVTNGDVRRIYLGIRPE
jgi:hypothetical protein